MRRYFLFFLGFVGYLRAVPPGPGMGIVVGAPVGITFKYWISRREAFDMVIGSYKNYVHLHGTYLYHFPQPSREAQFLPYVGIGARVKGSSNEIFIGVRVAGGFEIYYRPIGVFAEIAPIIDILPPQMDMNVGVGLRIYF